MNIDIVWFKRDFRLEDHAPINAVATSNNDFLGIFIIEPSRFKQKDNDPIHIDWELKCAIKLQNRIRLLGGEMFILHGEVIDIFKEISSKYNISNIYSHEETGTEWSYNRDIEVASWFESRKINWKEYPTNAVIRRLKDRDNWYKSRTERLLKEVIPAPKLLKFNGESKFKSVKTIEELGLDNRELKKQYVPGEIETDESTTTIGDKTTSATSTQVTNTVKVGFDASRCHLFDSSKQAFK